MTESAGKTAQPRRRKRDHLGRLQRGPPQTGEKRIAARTDESFGTSEAPNAQVAQYLLLQCELCVVPSVRGLWRWPPGVPHSPTGRADSTVVTFIDHA